jgi:hypothetical protein
MGIYMGLDKIIVIISVLVITIILVGIQRHSRRNEQQDKENNSAGKQ